MVDKIRVFNPWRHRNYPKPSSERLLGKVIEVLIKWLFFQMAEVREIPSGTYNLKLGETFQSHGDKPAYHALKCKNFVQIKNFFAVS